jgi:hypothetical protein
LAARRKELGADLIEEMMFYWEGRSVEGKDGKEGKKEVRRMHLQTADMRMPFYKAKNWDLLAVTAMRVTTMARGASWVGKIVWVHRFMFGHVLEKFRG